MKFITSTSFLAIVAIIVAISLLSGYLFHPMITSLIHAFSFIIITYILFEKQLQKNIDNSVQEEEIKTVNQSHNNIDIAAKIIEDKSFLINSIENNNHSSTCSHLLWTICNYTNASVGVLYLNSELNPKYCSLIAQYALQDEINIKKECRIGEGLIGQAAKSFNKIIINNIENKATNISSGLGENPPHQLVTLPISYDRKNTLIIQIGTFKDVLPYELSVIEAVGESFQEKILEEVNNKNEQTETDLEKVANA